MRQVDSQFFSNISANTAAFTLEGGLYGVDVLGTGFGTVTLQKLCGDGLTWTPALTAFAANGYASVSLPRGQYRFALATATAVSANIVRIPTD